MNKILIIDDELQLCELISRYASSIGLEPVIAHTIDDGIRKARSAHPGVVFLDIFLPDGSGLDAISQLKDMPNAPEVIVMTGMGDAESAESAIRRGAWSYVLKGTGLKPFADTLTQVMTYRQEKQESRSQISGESIGIIGSSPQIRTCLERAAEAAQTDANVLITGETGTGKELLARAIHKHSQHRNHNFVVVDCTALPENVVESIVFGHAKGSFTGASRTHEGLIKQADGGTLFVDEVGELPLTLQKPFLRVLQEHTFRPVGSDVEVASRFRLIAATHRDLDAMSTTDQFRQDLLYRIKAFHIVMPSLRERVTDIREIATFQLGLICQRNNIPLKKLSDDFVQMLERYPWPGNVRELLQAMESAITSGRTRDTLFCRQLPQHIQIAVARESTRERETSSPRPVDQSAVTLPPLKVVREQAADRAEREYLANLVRLVDGNVRTACQLSDLSRSRLYALLQKHRLVFRQ